ncbi:MAG: RdgB/HAM1 family non-canonical purine NTP pyrophosphatase [Candidatus Magasanikbacteria bacterium]|nr:RdgB/HAM1 family non-canonical purine NTP pyrophosphatase [Candidatus Magasanikbacteria bacterium]
MNKILIATGNQGKFEEISSFLDNQSIDFISLQDIDTSIPEPEETEDTIEGNAILKAKYYANKTGYCALADDTGLFVDKLDGWPGVKTARIAGSDEERRSTLMKKMRGLQDTDRSASFQSALALFNPDEDSIFVAIGKKNGYIISEKESFEAVGMCYDPIFYIKEKHKTYSQMDVVEKNGLSHRGKALTMMKYHLDKSYGPRHIVVPIGILIKDKKVLMLLRNDPFRKEYHKKWEFPGGSMEIGESLLENIKREMREETGYNVNVEKFLPYVGVEDQAGKWWKYQVYLLPFLCSIKSGDGKFSDREAIESRWFGLDKVLDQDLIGLNDVLYKKILPELKKITKELKL